MYITSVSDFRKAVRLGMHAWPGGHPLYVIMADGEALHPSVLRDKSIRRNILEAIQAAQDKANNKVSKYAIDTQWQPEAIDINYEDDNLYCAHTNQKIDCAYPNE